MGNVPGGKSGLSGDAEVFSNLAASYSDDGDWSGDVFYSSYRYAGGDPGAGPLVVF